MRTFEAQYPGYCLNCLTDFPAGTKVYRDMAGKIVHDSCPSDLELKNEVCSSCFQEKSNTGKCGCD